MVINRNTLGHLEEPDFILVKASEERVGILQCTHKTWQHKFNDLDTLSFEIPYLTDNEPTPFYDDIDIMKYIEAPSVGRFCIKDIEIVNEGQRTEYKKVECQDYSCLLGQRYIEDLSINTGTTGSLNSIALAPDGDQEHSLMYIVLEKCPEWTFYVAPSLRTKKRSFEVTRQDVYSFMTDDMADAFECIFEFDSMSKAINVYEVDSTHWTDTNIHVSYNSLLEKTEMSYSTDDIKTAVKLKGSDNLDVREINLGNEFIYNLDYYASEDFMSSSLLTAYNRWKNLVNTAVDLSIFDFSKPSVVSRNELQGKTYKEAFTLLLSKYQNYYTDISKWNSTLLPEGVNTRKNPGYGTVIVNGTKYVFEKQESVQLVTSLPSSGDATVLYLIKDSTDMYRWKNTWVNVNKWDGIALAELKTLQSSAANLKSVAAKAGYGNPTGNPTGKPTSSSKSEQERINEARYIDTYLPPQYMFDAIEAQIKVVQTTLSNLKDDQSLVLKNKNAIVDKVAMKNNFTTVQLKELSSFIREDEITSTNFLVTDVMTESERFDMLYALLDYGEEELAKACVPQIQFSADMDNLFAIPEFDQYSGNFDIGNSVWITLRDDYSIKAKILEIELDFLDQSKFKVTFGNVMRTAKNIFTDVTDALNMATAAATSVSFNASNWNASAEETESIGQALSEGLLSQAYYIASPEDNETQIDENGIWITTTTGPYGRNEHSNYDSIYLGGGRILFTTDGWKTVSMSVGRADVNYPHINSSTGNLSYEIESRFGVFADFLIAGYVGGSIMVGGDIYSAQYRTSKSDKNHGNYGSHIDLKNGTFEFNSPISFIDKKDGKKRLTLSTVTENDQEIDVLEVNGVIHAKEGNIGSDDDGAGGFIIKHWQLYSGKDSFNAQKNGIYLGSNTASNLESENGISLGTWDSNRKRNPFSVDMTGYLVANKGLIANFNLNDSSLYTTGKATHDSNSDGVFISNEHICLGKNATYYHDKSDGTITTETKNLFQVDSDGKLYAGNVNVSGIIYAKEGHIGGNSDGTGGFIIKNYMLYSGKTSFNDDNNNGIYLGSNTNPQQLTINGISLGKFDPDRQRNPFSVDLKGHLVADDAKLAEFTLNKTSLYIDKESMSAKKNGIYIGLDKTSATEKERTENSGIGLGGETTYYINDAAQTVTKSKFQVDVTGQLYAGAVNIQGRITASEGFIGDGKNGFVIKDKYIANGKSSLWDTNEGIYLGTNGIVLGASVKDATTGKWTHKFLVTSVGKLYSTSGLIGGWDIGTDTISHESDGNTITLSAKDNKLSINGKIDLNGDGSLTVKSGKFSIDTNGKIHSTGGDIGGFTITTSELYNNKSTLNATSSGVYVGTSGISLGTTTSAGVPKFRVTSAGELTCTSGSIAGWTIDPYKMVSPKDSSGNQTVINSNGTLRHTNGSEHNWQINTDGTATFKHITLTEWVSIDDVQSGSKFGDNFGWKDGVNWGQFNGKSLFDSSYNSPFQGNCITHIERLAINKLEVEWLDAGTIKASLLTADHITTGTLDASKVQVVKIDASNITTGTLSAARIDADNLSVKAANISGKLSAGKIEWNEHSVDQVEGYVFNDTPTGFVNTDGTLHISNVRKMHIMGYYS